VSAGEQAAPLEVRQVWRERRSGRMVVIVDLADGLVLAVDPERDEELLGRELELHARFDYIGLDVHGENPDRAPGATQALTLRGLQNRSSGRLRALIAEAGRRRHVARLARQVLALRGENPGTPDPSREGER